MKASGKLDPSTLEVGFRMETRWHGQHAKIREPLTCSPPHILLESLSIEPSSVGAGEDPTAGTGNPDGLAHEICVVTLNAKDAVLLTAREGRRIKDNAIKPEFALGEELQPLVDVAFREILGGRIEAVRGEVVASP